MSTQDNSTPLIIIAVVIIGAAAWWIHAKVVALSAFLGLDTVTTYSMLRRFVALAVIVGFVAYMGYFRRFWPYLAVGVFMCTLPALDHLSMNYVIEDFAFNDEPAWYGKAWVQGLIALTLLGVGFFLSNRDEYA